MRLKIRKHKGRWHVIDPAFPHPIFKSADTWDESIKWATTAPPWLVSLHEAIKANRG